MQCQNCQKETKNPKFCSLKCSAGYLKNLGKSLGNGPCTRKEEYFCSICQKSLGLGWKFKKVKYCQDCYKTHSGNYVDYSKVTLEDYFSNYPLHQVHAKIREKARNQLKKININSCQKCGYSIFIECCHIKPIKDFDRKTSIAEVNHINNLIGLCPNCHYELDNGFIKVADLEVESRLSNL